MGIKFRGKTSSGEPVNGSIKERELEVNLVDKHIFTSSNGVDVINLTEKEVGGIAWDANKKYKVGTMVTFGNDLFISKIQSTGVSPITGTTSIQWEFKTIDLSSMNSAKVNRVGDDAITGNFRVGKYFSTGLDADIGKNLTVDGDTTVNKYFNIGSFDNVAADSMKSYFKDTTWRIDAANTDIDVRIGGSLETTRVIKVGTTLTVVGNTAMGGNTTISGTTTANGTLTGNKYFNIGSYDGVVADAMQSYFRGSTWNISALHGAMDVKVGGLTVTTEKANNVSRSGHMCYDTGLQLCWGAATANQWTMFSRAFAVTPLVLVTEFDDNTSEAIDTYKTDSRISTTRFVANTKGDGGGSAYYIAIGRGA